MGTRGLLGFLIRGQRRGIAEGGDAGHEGLGAAIVFFILLLQDDDYYNMAEKLTVLKWVDPSDMASAEESDRMRALDIHYRIDLSDDVKDQGPLTWSKATSRLYSAMTLAFVLSGQITTLPEMTDFAHDYTFCEYAYWLDFDKRLFYVGHDIDSPATRCYTFAELRSDRAGYWHKRAVSKLVSEERSAIIVARNTQYKRAQRRGKAMIQEAMNKKEEAGNQRGSFGRSGAETPGEDEVMLEAIPEPTVSAGEKADEGIADVTDMLTIAIPAEPVHSIAEAKIDPTEFPADWQQVSVPSEFRDLHYTVQPVAARMFRYDFLGRCAMFVNNYITRDVKRMNQYMRDTGRWDRREGLAPGAGWMDELGLTAEGFIRNRPGEQVDFISRWTSASRRVTDGLSLLDSWMSISISAIGQGTAPRDNEEGPVVAIQ